MRAVRAEPVVTSRIENEHEPTYVVEVSDTCINFNFRIKNISSGATSNWAGYEEIAGLEGKYTATDYYLSDGTKFPLLSAEVILEYIIA